MPTKKKRRTVEVGDYASMMIKHVMEKKVQAVHFRAQGDVIASLMIEGFGAVPVLDEQRTLVGIVSEHDLLGVIDDGESLSTVKAGDIMTRNPYSVRPETSLGTLVHVFRASDLVRVPVVDARGRLVGIIARRDLLRTYLSTASTSRK